MMKHFLLNQAYPSTLSFDLNATLRSKIASLEDFINIIWPIVYAVEENGWQVIDMRGNNLEKGTVALFIDRCDQQYVHLRDRELQGRTRTANGKQNLAEMIEKEPVLRPLRDLIEDFKEKKGKAHVDILPLEDISELKVLDLDGKFGFDAFIQELTR